MFPAAFMGGMGGMGMAPAYSGVFPLGRRMPAKPNPLVNPPKPNYAHADVAGVQQALQKRSAVCHSALNPSAVGESGLSSRYDDEGQLRGKEAFESLGKYMKTAGLNPFQAAFFAHAVIEGLTEPEVQQAVKRAGDQFGPDVAAELQNGLEKLAAGWQGGFVRPAASMALSGIKGLGRGLGKVITNPVTQTIGAGAILHGTGKGLNENAAGMRADAAGALADIKSNMNSHADKLHATAENTSNDLRQRFGQMQEAVTRNADLAGKSSSGFFDNANQTLSGLKSGLGGATDFLRNNPMLALLAAGGGLGGLMGGGRGALAGGLGLPLLYMLMQGSQGGKNPFSALSSYFGGSGAAGGGAGAGAGAAAPKQSLTGAAPAAAAKPPIAPKPFAPTTSTPKYPVSPMGAKPPLGGVKPPQSFVPMSSTPKYPVSPIGPAR